MPNNDYILRSYDEDYIMRGDAVAAVFERIKQIGMQGNPYVLSIQQAVREVPAADVEHVVHCKDCIHAEPLEGHEPDILCQWWCHPMPPKGFCCKGTRKKEKKNEPS